MIVSVDVNSCNRTSCGFGGDSTCQMRASMWDILSERLGHVGGGLLPAR
jgi:hypothetical protein